MLWAKYNTAFTFEIAILKRAVVDFAVSADWTPAAGDVKISKDGGAAANVTNLPTAITMGNTAIWQFVLTATEMSAARVVITVADSATKAVEDQLIYVQTYGNASAQHAFDLGTALASQTVGTATAVTTVNGLAANTITAASIATDAITAAKIAADAIGASEIADGAIDAATFAAGAINAAAIATDAITAAKIAADAIGASEIADGAIDAATFAAGAINAAAIAADAITDAKVAADVTIASVTGAVGSVTGAVGSVTGNVGGNVTGTVASVVGAVGSVTGNVGGNVTGSVGSVAAGGIASSSFAAGAIDATAIATDAIGSAELAATAVTEIADGVLDRAIAEPSGAFAWASASLRTIIQFLGIESRNKLTQTATTTKIRNNADNADLASSTVSDDGTTFTRGSWS